MQFVPMCVVTEVELIIVTMIAEHCHCIVVPQPHYVLSSSPNNINLVAANRPIAINYNQHDTRKIQTHHIRLFPHFSQSTDKSIDFPFRCAL